MHPTPTQLDTELNHTDVPTPGTPYSLRLLHPTDLRGLIQVVPHPQPVVLAGGHYLAACGRGLEGQAAAN